jgi:tetratricopeptide (TPR) repeat protein
MFSRFSDPKLYSHPMRMKYILEYVKKYPKEVLSNTPYVHVDPKKSPNDYQTIKAEWCKHLNNNVGDAKIARGAANFFYLDDKDKAIETLLNVVENDPTQAELWIDLGRYTTDAKQRMEYFDKAGKYGSKHPNLPVWFAKSAVEANEYEMAKLVAVKILTLVDRLYNKYGNKLYWKETGEVMREKAYKVMGSKKLANLLTSAISEHSYYKHYAYITLGHVALAEGDISSSIEYLKESGNIGSDYRLSSYGPDFSLAKKLSQENEWSAVEKYLHLCSQFWEDKRLMKWLTMIQQHKIPDFL